jgi:hypothetical protein
MATQHPDPPQEKDANVLLAPALSTLSFPDDSTNLPFFGGVTLSRSLPLDPAAISEARDWLDRNKSALAAVPWDRLSGAWFGPGYSRGLGAVTTGPLMPTMQLARLLCLQAVVEADQDQAAAAANSLRRALLVAHTVTNDLPIHQMVRLTGESIASDVLQHVLNRVALQDTDLAWLGTNLTTTNLDGVREYVVTERCMGIFDANTLRSEAGGTDSAGLSTSNGVARTWRGYLVYRESDLLNYLDWCDRSMAALDRPLSNAQATLGDMQEEHAAALKATHYPILSIFDRNRVSLMTAMEMDLSQILPGYARGVAEVCVTVTALAVERWRLAHHGRLPASLADLVPQYLAAIPSDPYDNLPLRYRILPKGYVVYSIGPDFKDDHGLEKPASSEESDHYDITFVVER